MSDMTGNTVADLHTHLGSWVRSGEVVGRCEWIATKLVREPVGERVYVELSIRGLGARRGKKVRGWLDSLELESVFGGEAA